jgi:nucleotide-binding universal stress UspA family protein
MIFQKIVVPTDGSELADRIIGPVGRLLRREDARVVFVTVVPHSDADAHQGAEDPVTIARQHVEKLARALVAEGASASARVLLGDAAARILDCASEEKASLIALSTHGRSGLSRFVRGSVAERVLRTATVPVLLANPHGLAPAKDARIGRILVPLDGSARSASILPFAAEIAFLYESELILLHVDDGKGTAKTAGALEQVGRTVADVPFTQKTVRGPAAESILEVAGAQKVGLVAMTTHGASGVTRWAFGSVAEKVLREVACPVLVVRTAE